MSEQAPVSFQCFPKFCPVEKGTLGGAHLATLSPFRGDEGTVLICYCHLLSEPYTMGASQSNSYPGQANAHKAQEKDRTQHRCRGSPRGQPGQHLQALTLLPSLTQASSLHRAGGKILRGDGWKNQAALESGFSHRSTSFSMGLKEAAFCLSCGHSKVETLARGPSWQDWWQKDRQEHGVQQACALLPTTGAGRTGALGKC